MDFSLAFVNFIILSILALLFTLQILKSSKVKVPKTHPPPQAAGAWPIIGHLQLFGGPKLPHLTLADLANKHGSAFGIRLGVHQVLVVSSWAVAKELFTTNDIAVSSRPKLLATKLMGYDYAMFGFSPYGPYWRELRKLSTVHLLSATRLELLQHVHVSETEFFVQELYKIWREKKDQSSRVLVEMKQRFRDLTLNIILRAVAGKRYSSNLDGVQKKEAERCTKAVKDFMDLLGAFVVADYFPWLRWFDIGGYEKKMKETALEMDDLLEAWMNEHRRGRKSGEGETTVEQDFMDVMLSIIPEDANIDGHDAARIIKSTCMSMVVGGSDTTAVTLTWALALLLNNENALRKAQKEIDDQVGKERRVNKSDISNLPYLQAIVKETMRLYPAGFLGGIREVTENCTVSGFDIRKGTRLILNLWKIHRDPVVWEDPLEFRPERFLTDHKDVDVKGQNFELMPFGGGRRICPGIAFALPILHFVLANLLQAFDFSTPAVLPLDMTASAGLSNIKATSLDVLISPRLEPSLYY